MCFILFCLNYNYSFNAPRPMGVLCFVPYLRERYYFRELALCDIYSVPNACFLVLYKHEQNLLASKYRHIYKNKSIHKIREINFYAERRTHIFHVLVAFILYMC